MGGSMMRACTKCLLYSDMKLYLHPHPLPAHLLERISIGDDGVCNVCLAYQEQFDAEIPGDELEQLDFEAGGMDAPVVVALSGGKDSLSALYAATALLKLRTVAAVFKNGFVPDEVLQKWYLLAGTQCTR
jgi:predicted PP-loop superfamily ATPase